eukprot:gene20536-21192_t
MYVSYGVTIVQEGSFTGPEIDAGKLIDNVTMTTILSPSEIPVPSQKFLETFGISYEDALKNNMVYKALDLLDYLKVDADGLNTLWAAALKVKLGGGFYAGRIEKEGFPPVFTFNAFFMTLRSGFVKPDVSIYYYDLGLTTKPNVGENSVHASASPFEGLAERLNWLNAKIATDSFGAKLLEAGVSEATILAWSKDPQVAGKSIFDQLEDLDAPEALAKIVALSKL